MIRYLLCICLLLGACSPRLGDAVPSAPRETAPAALRARLKTLVARFEPGRAGVAVVHVQHGWAAAVNGDRPFQQQSVFKTWVAVATLHEVDRGNLRWDERVRITRDDLIFPYQPIEKEVGPQGREFSIEELVRWSVIVSDNPSVDALLKRLGGPANAQAALNRIGVHGVRLDVGERGLHAIADSFRNALAAAAEPKQAVFERGFSDLRNTATPSGTAQALAKLKRGELLSLESTERLLKIMSETSTGPNRLQAGLAPGWTLAHKTGTGGEVDGATLGTGDIGLLTAPDGRSYAVAVFTWGTRKPLAERERLMAEVARAVVTQHSGLATVAIN